MARAPRRKSGAALIESCLVMIMLCLILFGVLQVSYLIGARDVIAYAAVGVARSAAVGFDDFMLYKAARMFTIPTAGPMIQPDLSAGGGRFNDYSAGETWDLALETHPENEQYWTERFLIPFYLGAESPAEARAVLNYDNWEQGITRIQSPELHGQNTLSDEILDTPVRQLVPLTMPFARAFFRDNLYELHRTNFESVEGPEVPHFEIRESAVMENHAAYYMTNGMWGTP